MTIQITTPWAEKRDTHRLMNVALGKRPADIVICNANLVNVYTGEIQENQCVSITDKWIAYVGEDAQYAMGTDTRVIDAHHKTIIPGLIDGHTHLGWMCSIDEYLTHIIPGGTTTLVTEALEPYPIGGLEAVTEFLASLKNQPLKLLATAPTMVSISKHAGRMPMTDLETMLSLDNVIGLGESYWQNVLQQPEDLLPRFAAAVSKGKTLEGHSAGASERKLNAYTATGITSCHEPIKAEEVLTRLRLGIHVMAREGSIRRDLEEIARINNGKSDLRRLILVTDGINPSDLLTHGYMEHVVQKAIQVGFDPIAAVQMASLNVAEHFGIDHLVGGIAPGRFADILIIPDQNTIKPQTVISNGQIIYDQGKLLSSPRKHRYSLKSQNSIRLQKRFEPIDFALKSTTSTKTVVVRAMELISDLVTKETQLEMLPKNGEINCDIEKDILYLTAIDRSINPGKTFSGFVKGFGLRSGAFASSAAWDTSDIIVIGSNHDDMAAAVNHLATIQGGYVLWDNGKLICDVPLPIWGLISNLNTGDLVQRISDMRRILSDLGVPFPDPLLTIITLTGAAIPFLRICEEGYVDLKTGITHGLLV